MTPPLPIARFNGVPQVWGRAHWEECRRLSSYNRRLEVPDLRCDEEAYQNENMILFV